MLSVEKFLEIEEKYNLYEDTVDGINYWVYARYQIWENLLKNIQPELGESHVVAKKNIWEKLIIYRKLLIRGIFQGRIKKTDICFLGHPRRIYENGIYKCKYTEALVREFSNSCVLEYPYQMRHYAPVETQNLVYLDILQIKSVLLYLAYRCLMKPKYYRLENAVREKTQNLFQELEKNFNIKIDLDKNVHFIVEQIIYYKASVSSLEKIINKLNPKIFIGVVGYDLTCMMINEICKKKHIPTVELQHGALHEIAYKYKTKYQIKQLPDYILLFSEFWKNYINLPMLEKRIITVGFPYFEYQVKQAKRIEKYCDDKCNILFLSQGLIGKKLSELAMDLSKKIDMNKYRVFYKLHPGEYEVWQENYKGLKESNLIVLDSQEYSLYDYFATSQIQIGVSSTALYEGLGFGCRTFIYHIETSEQYAGYLCDAGYAKYVENCEELIKRILCEESENCQTKGLWKENSLNNMKKIICEIVEEGKGIECEKNISYRF